MRIKYLVLFLLLIPVTSFAGVRINEVAWMGTTNSANDEWIELYNDDSSTVDMSGWALSASDGAPTINLSGSISGSSYFLLERTDDSSVSTVSADQIYSGVLGNDGEALTLKNSTGSIQDRVIHSSGWEGGDNTTKDTMQRDGSGWTTAKATPRSQNNLNTVEINEDNQNSGNGGHNTETESSRSIHNEKKDVIDYFKLNVRVDPVIVSGVPAEFVVSLYKNNVRKIDGIHSWSFGDGTLVEHIEHSRKNDMEFNHTYQNPGTYVAIFEYRTSLLKKEPDISHRIDIEVTDHQVVISSIDPYDSITLSNLTKEEIDIGRWWLRTGSEEYQFPVNTILLPKSNIMFSYKTLGIPLLGTTLLLLPDGTVIGNISRANNVPTVSMAKKVKIAEPIVTANESDVIRPLNEKASVIFSQDDVVHKNNMNSLLYVFLIVVLLVSVAGVLVSGLYLYITKTPTSDDIGVDDITILED